MINFGYEALSIGLSMVSSAAFSCRRWHIFIVAGILLASNMSRMLVSAVPVTATYTSSTTFTVPPGVTSVSVDICGAAGGTLGTYAGGLGGRVQATISVDSSDVWAITVGGTGGCAPAGSNNVGGAGANGGGNGKNGGGTACGGGGMTDIKFNGNFLAVGGGGGGSYHNCQSVGGAGGSASGYGTGGTACLGSCSGCPTLSTGGTHTSGGSASCCTTSPVADMDGLVGQGGNGYRGGGGGGGGYYGGGGGGNGIAGAGGSSWVDSGVATNIIYGTCSSGSTPSVTLTYDPASQAPTAVPSVVPTAVASTVPTTTPVPTIVPTAVPTVTPTAAPTTLPSSQPSSMPSEQPSAIPSSQPLVKPSAAPSQGPSVAPTVQPTIQPTTWPSQQPSGQPSLAPTIVPTLQPTSEPSRQPTTNPSQQPFSAPSTQPSHQPSSFPTAQPSSQPSVCPSVQPSSSPSESPSVQPTTVPSASPTLQPSPQPTSEPTSQPATEPSPDPTMSPSSQPSCLPSSQPSTMPSIQPSTVPSSEPTLSPSTQPSLQPSIQPTALPSHQPSSCPSVQPSSDPTGSPSSQPNSQPTMQPSSIPSSQPNSQPTMQPSSIPSSIPSSLPSEQPSSQPSSIPSSIPSSLPSEQPSSQPSSIPSSLPSEQPSSQPSAQPTNWPTFPPSENYFINTYCGSGVALSLGDYDLADRASVNRPLGLSGQRPTYRTHNLFVTEYAGCVIRKVSSTTNIISTIGGVGLCSSAYLESDIVQSKPATSSTLYVPYGAYMDSTGHLYITEYAGHTVRVIDESTGNISIVAGNGIAGITGDNGPASSATMLNPTHITGNSLGDLYVSDVSAHTVRIIYYNDDSSTVNMWSALTDDIDNESNSSFTELVNQTDSVNEQPKRMIALFAGTRVSGNGEDSVESATATALREPRGLWIDSSLSVYVVDGGNHKIRKVTLGGAITTIAGTGLAGLTRLTISGADQAGGEEVALESRLNEPNHVWGNSVGALFISDSRNNRIRQLTLSSGIITTLIGSNADAGFAGDGGLAVDASMDFPTGIWGVGNLLYVADTNNNRVRVVTAAPFPTIAPSAVPSHPTMYPSAHPTREPSAAPSGPSKSPTVMPSAPTFRPTRIPTAEPTLFQRAVPNISVISLLSIEPTGTNSSAMNVYVRVILEQDFANVYGNTSVVYCGAFPPLANSTSTSTTRYGDSSSGGSGNGAYANIKSFIQPTNVVDVMSQQYTAFAVEGTATVTLHNLPASASYAVFCVAVSPQWEEMRIRDVVRPGLPLVVHTPCCKTIAVRVSPSYIVPLVYNKYEQRGGQEEAEEEQLQHVIHVTLSDSPDDVDGLTVHVYFTVLQSFPAENGTSISSSSSIGRLEISSSVSNEDYGYIYPAKKTFTPQHWHNPTAYSSFIATKHLAVAQPVTFDFVFVAGTLVADLLVHVNITGPSTEQYKLKQEKEIILNVRNTSSSSSSSGESNLSLDKPQILSAVCLSDWTGIVVTFDQPTNLGDYTFGVRFRCSEFFVFVNNMYGSNSSSNSSSDSSSSLYSDEWLAEFTCEWLDETRLLLSPLSTLTITDSSSGSSSSSRVVLGLGQLLNEEVSLSLRPNNGIYPSFPAAGIILKASDSSDGLTSYASQLLLLEAAAQNVTVQYPLLPFHPRVVLVAPSTANRCTGNDFTLDVSLSSGNGGQLWESITFTVYEDQLVSENASALASYINEEITLMKKSSLAVTVPYSLFSAGKTYIFQVEMCNFANFCGETMASSSIAAADASDAYISNSDAGLGLTGVAINSAKFRYSGISSPLLFSGILYKQNDVCFGAAIIGSTTNEDGVDSGGGGSGGSSSITGSVDAGSVLDWILFQHPEKLLSGGAGDNNGERVAVLSTRTVASASAQYSTFTVPAYFLEIDSQYELLFRYYKNETTVNGDKEIGRLVSGGEHSIFLTTSAGNIVPVIKTVDVSTGNSSPLLAQYLVKGSYLLLSALDSYDEDTSETAAEEQFEYSWSCVDIQPFYGSGCSLNLLPVLAASTTTTTTSATSTGLINVSASAASTPGAVVQIALTVCDSYNNLQMLSTPTKNIRCAATVILLDIASQDRTVVSISTDAVMYSTTRLDLSRSLLLKGSLKVLYEPCVARWSSADVSSLLASTGADSYNNDSSSSRNLSYIASTPTTRSFPVGYSGGFNLVIPSGNLLYALSGASNSNSALLGGGISISKLTFSLSCNSAGSTVVRNSNDSSSSSSNTITSSVTLYINAPPALGSLVVTPISGGIALTTMFRMSGQQWTDATEDLPLSYQFGYMQPVGSTNDADATGSDDRVGAQEEQLYLILTSPSEISNTQAPLPPGCFDCNPMYMLTVTLQVFDIYDASSRTAIDVEVVPDSDTVALAEVINDLYTSALSVTTNGREDETNTVLQYVNAVSSAVNAAKFNCTGAPTVLCTRLNRHSCSATAHTCGDCKEGYLGEIGHHNLPCLSRTASFSDMSLLSRTGRFSSSSSSSSLSSPMVSLKEATKCETDADCFPDWQYCSSTSSLCEIYSKLNYLSYLRERQEDQPLLTASLPPETALLSCGRGVGQGRPVVMWTHAGGNYPTEDGNEIFSQCKLTDFHCKIVCNCTNGFSGMNCEISHDDLISRKKMKSQLLTVLVMLMKQRSEEAEETLASSMSSSSSTLSAAKAKHLQGLESSLSTLWVIVEDVFDISDSDVHQIVLPMLYQMLDECSGSDPSSAAAAAVGSFASSSSSSSGSINYDIGKHFIADVSNAHYILWIANALQSVRSYNYIANNATVADATASATHDGADQDVDRSVFSAVVLSYAELVSASLPYRYGDQTFNQKAKVHSNSRYASYSAPLQQLVSLEEETEMGRETANGDSTLQQQGLSVAKLLMVAASPKSFFEETFGGPVLAFVQSHIDSSAVVMLGPTSFSLSSAQSQSQSQSLVLEMDAAKLATSTTLYGSVVVSSASAYGGGQVLESASSTSSSSRGSIHTGMVATPLLLDLRAVTSSASLLVGANNASSSSSSSSLALRANLSIAFYNAYYNPSGAANAREIMSMRHTDNRPRSGSSSSSTNRGSIVDSNSSAYSKYYSMHKSTSTSLTYFYECQGEGDTSNGVYYCPHLAGNWLEYDCKGRTAGRYSGACTLGTTVCDLIELSSSSPSSSATAGATGSKLSAATGVNKQSTNIQCEPSYDATSKSMDTTSGLLLENSEFFYCTCYNVRIPLSSTPGPSSSSSSSSTEGTTKNSVGSGSSSKLSFANESYSLLLQPMLWVVSSAVYTPSYSSFKDQGNGDNSSATGNLVVLAVFSLIYVAAIVLWVLAVSQNSHGEAPAAKTNAMVSSVASAAYDDKIQPASKEYCEPMDDEMSTPRVAMVEEGRNQQQQQQQQHQQQQQQQPPLTAVAAADHTALTSTPLCAQQKTEWTIISVDDFSSITKEYINGIVPGVFCEGLSVLQFIYLFMQKHKYLSAVKYQVAATATATATTTTTTTTTNMISSDKCDHVRNTHQIPGYAESTGNFTVWSVMRLLTAQSVAALCLAALLVAQDASVRYGEGYCDGVYEAALKQHMGDHQGSESGIGIDILDMEGYCARQKTLLDAEQSVCMLVYRGGEEEVSSAIASLEQTPGVIGDDATSYWSCDSTSIAFSLHVIVLAVCISTIVMVFVDQVLVIKLVNLASSPVEEESISSGGGGEQTLPPAGTSSESSYSLHQQQQSRSRSRSRHAVVPLESATSTKPTTSTPAHTPSGSIVSTEADFESIVLGDGGVRYNVSNAFPPAGSSSSSSSKGTAAGNSGLNRSSSSSSSSISPSSSAASMLDAHISGIRICPRRLPRRLIAIRRSLAHALQYQYRVVGVKQPLEASCVVGTVVAGSSSSSSSSSGQQVLRAFDGNSSGGGCGGSLGIEGAVSSSTPADADGDENEHANRKGTHVTPYCPPLLLVPLYKELKRARIDLIKVLGGPPPPPPDDDDDDEAQQSASCFRHPFLAQFDSNWGLFLNTFTDEDDVYRNVYTVLKWSGRSSAVLSQQVSVSATRAKYCLRRASSPAIGPELLGFHLIFQLLCDLMGGQSQQQQQQQQQQPQNKAVDCLILQRAVDDAFPPIVQCSHKKHLLSMTALIVLNATIFILALAISARMSGAAQMAYFIAVLVLVVWDILLVSSMETLLIHFVVPLTAKDQVLAAKSQVFTAVETFAEQLRAADAAATAATATDGHISTTTGKTVSASLGLAIGSGTRFQVNSVDNTTSFSKDASPNNLVLDYVCSPTDYLLAAKKWALLCSQESNNNNNNSEGNDVASPSLVADAAMASGQRHLMCNDANNNNNNSNNNNNNSDNKINSSSSSSSSSKDAGKFKQVLLECCIVLNYHNLFPGMVKDLYRRQRSHKVDDTSHIRAGSDHMNKARRNSTASQLCKTVLSFLVNHLTVVSLKCVLAELLPVLALLLFECSGRHLAVLSTVIGCCAVMAAVVAAVIYVLIWRANVGGGNNNNNDRNNCNNKKQPQQRSKKNEGSSGTDDSLLDLDGTILSSTRGSSSSQYSDEYFRLPLEHDQKRKSRFRLFQSENNNGYSSTRTSTDSRIRTSMTVPIILSSSQDVDNTRHANTETAGGNEQNITSFCDRNSETVAQEESATLISIDNNSALKPVSLGLSVEDEGLEYNIGDDDDGGESDQGSDEVNGGGSLSSSSNSSDQYASVSVSSSDDDDDDDDDDDTLSDGAKSASICGVTGDRGTTVVQYRRPHGSSVDSGQSIASSSNSSRP